MVWSVSPFELRLRLLLLDVDLLLQELGDLRVLHQLFKLVDGHVSVLGLHVLLVDLLLQLYHSLAFLVTIALVLVGAVRV